MYVLQAWRKPLEVVAYVRRVGGDSHLEAAEWLLDWQVCGCIGWGGGVLAAGEGRGGILLVVWAALGGGGVACLVGRAAGKGGGGRQRRAGGCTVLHYVLSVGQA
jgi:hypothetical protein